MTTDTRTQTERMWDAAAKLDSARAELMDAIRDLDAIGSRTVHFARNAALTVADAQTQLTKEASE